MKNLFMKRLMFIKLEYLFDRIVYFKNKEDPRENYNALSALAELYEILSIEVILKLNL